MEIKSDYRIKLFFLSSLLLLNIHLYGQNSSKERTLVSFDDFFLKKNKNELSVKNIQANNIQGFFGKPLSIKTYNQQWSDEYDEKLIYEFDSLEFKFNSLEGEEWLYYIGFNSSKISLKISDVNIQVGQRDTILNVYKNSWNSYLQLENTKDYQTKLKRGDRTKVFVLHFLIKEKTYEYYGLIFVNIVDEKIVKIELFFQEEA